MKHFLEDHERATSLDAVARELLRRVTLKAWTQHATVPQRGLPVTFGDRDSGDVVTVSWDVVFGPSRPATCRVQVHPVGRRWYVKIDGDILTTTGGQFARLFRMPGRAQKFGIRIAYRRSK